MVKISPYLDEYRPQNQDLFDGVPINPILRPDFDVTPNEDRDPLEKEDWWGWPYICNDNWDDNAESWEAHVERLKQYPDIKIRDKETYETEKLASKKAWLEAYPTGVRYDIRCLDGGAWDRSTMWGMVGSLEEAMKIIEKRSVDSASAASTA